MISLTPFGSTGQFRINRRDALRLGALSAVSPSLLSPSTAATSTTHCPTAKNCIYIFLCGGPSQLDMWDPKPHAPKEIRGPFHPIQTNVPGIEIGELLPHTARHADKLAVVRSMHHDSNSHDIGIMYTLLADSRPPSRLAYPAERSDHPGMGSILKYLMGSPQEVPAWVTVPRPFTTGDRFYKGQTGGFLGPAYDPFHMNEPKRDSLAHKEFRIEALTPPEGVSAARLDNRQALLQQIEKPLETAPEVRASQELEENYDKAFSLLSSDGARRAFDLTREADSLRNQYGRNEYGQSFLLARRLVEAGVRMVNVFWTFYGQDGCQFNLWDNHGSDQKVCGGYNNGLDMIRGEYCCPSFDRAYSALLDDLSQRGLLDETLVTVVGEFGRTPKINKFAGRDHWAACYSTVLAGGGIEGGQVYGESDRQAAYVKNAPVRPEDLGATILHAFGFDPETAVHDPTNRPVRASKGTPLAALF